MHRRAAFVFALTFTVAACGSDAATTANDTTESTTANSSPGTDTVDATTPDTTTPGTTSVEAGPANSEPATTEPEPTAPSTVPPTTTIDTTTSSAPQSAGWALATFEPNAYYEAYSDNWSGTPSPSAPASGQAPADGYYVATLLEPWAPGADHLSVRIERLELCSVLTDGCEGAEDGDMNLDPTWHLDLDVPLDQTTRVMVQGFSCWNEDGQGADLKQATGAELADLFDAFTADYDAAVAPRLAETTDTWQIALDVAAEPSGGFVGEQEFCPGDESLSGPLRYVHDDAPVLLLQTVVDWDGGPLDATDLVRLNSVQYTGGVPAFYFYAGFYS